MSEVAFSLLCSESFSCAFKLCQSLSESSGLFESQIKRSILLFLVDFSCLISSLLIDDCQNLGNGLSSSLYDYRINEEENMFLHLYGTVWLGGQLRPCLLSKRLILSRKKIIRLKRNITLNLTNSSTRPLSSFCLSSCAFTLYIFVNLIYN